VALPTRFTVGQESLLPALPHFLSKRSFLLKTVTFPHSGLFCLKGKPPSYRCFVSPRWSSRGGTPHRLFVSQVGPEGGERPILASQEGSRRGRKACSSFPRRVQKERKRPVLASQEGSRRRRKGCSSFPGRVQKRYIPPWYTLGHPPTLLDMPLPALFTHPRSGLGASWCTLWHIRPSMYTGWLTEYHF